MYDKHPGGRPLMFKSVEELQDKIDKYFLDCDQLEKPYTITGLALALDTDRHTLISYQNKEEFSHTIKNAKLKIENYSVEQLYRKAGQVAGIIFNLKNNFGWKDENITKISTTDEKVQMKLKELFDDEYKKDPE